MNNFEEKYYRGYVKINLDNLLYNIEIIKQNIVASTRIIAVVKADAYGHGMITISKTIEDNVYAFAVASIDEALLLKKNGIKKDIIILGFTPDNRIKDAIDANIRMTVYRIQDANRISIISKELNKKAYVHIKVDTGMNRIGFQINDEFYSELAKISIMDNIQIEGIYTHFTSADEVDSFTTEYQIKLFNNVLCTLHRMNINIGIKHCSNSAGIIDYKKAHMDAVRAGIIMYGEYPSVKYRLDQNSIRLKNVLEWKSHVIFTKDVEKNEKISYGGTYVTKRKSKIATIPIGYADGYPRLLSNIAEVLINGKRAPIIGKICMDQFMVDVTDIGNVQYGDEVTLLGTDGNENISANELANYAETINYEILCGISKRMPRVYYREGKVIENVDYFD